MSPTNDANGRSTTDNQEMVPVLQFAGGLPGFAELKEFSLVRWGGDNSPLSLLRSVEQPETEFVVAPPAAFFPDYTPEIDDATAERLNLQDSDDALMLVILNVDKEPADATANLMGPIVVNRHTLDAAQVVLTGQDYDVKTPLAAAS
jgi:flagellar assembly factor FliW